MCLRKIGKQKRSKKDIICYKHLIRNEETNSLCTTYKHMPVSIGGTYTSKLVKGQYNKREFMIEEGLHSFAALKSAMKDAEDNKSWLNRAVIVKCIIPKNSAYYKGTQFHLKGYASDWIKIVEVLDPETYKEKTFIKRFLSFLFH